MGHVRVVGAEVAEAQTEVEVIDTEVLGAEFQAQVGVGEPIGGLEVCGTSGSVEFQSPPVTSVKEIVTDVESDSAVGTVKTFVVIVTCFCHTDNGFDRDSYGQAVSERDSRSDAPVKCREFRIIKHTVPILISVGNENQAFGLTPAVLLSVCAVVTVSAFGTVVVSFWARALTAVPARSSRVAAVISAVLFIQVCVDYCSYR